MTRTHTSKVKWLYSLLVFFFSFSVVAQEGVSMLFVGDVMQHDAQIEAALNPKTGRYEYENGFQFIKPVIAPYAIRVANLEVTLAGKPYKGYPQFSAPDELAATLVKTGFNVILTANNHSCDRGDKGVIRTLDVLDQLGVKHTGTFRNREERNRTYPLMIDENGYKIAMLNYTYGTNGLTVQAPLIVNYIDSAVIRKDVERARELNADYIVCNLHWGVEYKSLPNSYQKFWESFCYDLGIDMVIGGHPHSVMPVEQKSIEGKDKLTVWSLGNFVSNMRTRITRGGLMVGTRIERNDTDEIEIKETHAHLIYVLKKKEGALTQYYILPDFDYNAYRPGFLSDEDLVHYNHFFSDSRALFSQHNTGITESIVKPDSPIGKQFQQLLTTYYSVQIHVEPDTLLNHEALGKFLHTTVDGEGNRHLLSGIFSNPEEAKGMLRFLRDCELPYTLNLVEVRPQTVEIWKE